MSCGELLSKNVEDEVRLSHSVGLWSHKLERILGFL